MRASCRYWPVLVALAAALAAIAGVVPAHAGVARASSGNQQAIVITSGTLGSSQHAIADLGTLTAGQSRTFPIDIRNDTASDVTARLAEVAFPGDQSQVLQSGATVTLKAGSTILGTGSPGSSRLIGASTVIGAGVTRQLTAEISLPSSAGHPVVRGHSLTAEFSFQSKAGSAPIQTGISTGSGPGLPATAESLSIFHGMVWASLAALALAVVLGFFLAFRRLAPGEGSRG